ncbi:HelD family protein [Desulfosporosinus meridiei]|uniref:DNA/RNA helicase, superfamily I n=1 Tax=Desulfosporosinus meridiei (strain ATCC BAA-275 / DSM 13257 / KCTC 12902 / NCIMB 13706 / S10) TaxID=768704 RepID=J7IW61_DESMD|nr:UvrD-helicase domain-containing protein [Desulfosporosinus meridiei]AFQ43333.1 DNA/RNA helicase, superfamily I [Desulfosporosinus meridiei DSM 13257]
MDSYQENHQEEIEYLKKTLAFIEEEVKKEEKNLEEKKSDLIAAKKDMYENTVHIASDFESLVDINLHLMQVNNHISGYDTRRIKNLKKMINSPYFGRFDFIEKGFNEKEKIYIGLYNLMDKNTGEVYVYDWRAPISSVFYRYELGEVMYDTPAGVSRGDVSLKRQYQIRDSQLKYFFDCSVRITDEILQEVLSHNTSAKMKNIIETIQKEQDVIIRDRDHELLIVQGVAGSGKTSIALHRIAFLLYEGLNTNLQSKDVIIISPNSVFSHYISSVLPELGEENVRQSIFDDLVLEVLQGRFGKETREMQLEALIHSRVKIGDEGRKKSIDFKGSRVFKKILDRLLWHYAHRLIEFEDVYYNGTILATRQQLKNRFLHNEIGIPMAKQLNKIETILLQKVHPLQKKRLKRLEKIVEKSEGHEFEIKSFSRLLAIKQAVAFRDRIQKFTKVDYGDLYTQLFKNRGLLHKLAQGLTLPENINEIISTTLQNLEEGQVHYEDYAPLLYLKLKVEGNNVVSGIKHVVIDEAQDYTPLQYEVFKILYDNATYTVLGDIRQAIEKPIDYSLYDDVSEILNKGKTIKLSLNKGYRSTCEINAFTQKLLGEGNQHDYCSIERYGEEPKVIQRETLEGIDQSIIADIGNYTQQGYESVAIICKTQKEAEKVFSRLKKSVQLTLIKPQEGEVIKGALVIPTYMAKGLEFDVVIIYDVNKENYVSDFDRQLLYIGCTRALHRLVIYHKGDKSPLI